MPRRSSLALLVSLSIPLSIALSCLIAPFAHAVPGTLAASGVLSTVAGGPVADGSYALTFRLWGAAKDGEALWTEVHAGVDVKFGVFTAVLGGGTVPAPIDVALLVSHPNPWLSVQVGSDPEMSRVPLHSAAFAMVAGRADVADKLAAPLTAEGIAQGAVTADKVAFTYAGSDQKDGAAKVALALQCSGCLTTDQIAAGAIQANQVAFPWAAGKGPGGAAIGLSCSGCVDEEALAEGVDKRYVNAAGDAMAGGLVVMGKLAVGKAQASAQLDVAGKIAASEIAAAGIAIGDTGLTVAGKVDFAGDVAVGDGLTVAKGLTVGSVLAVDAAALDMQKHAILALRLHPAAGAPYVCDEAVAGAVYFDTDKHGFFGCNGKAWRSFAAPAPGSMASVPAKSCKSIVDSGDSQGDGVYWLDPDGGDVANAFEVWCDMTVDGGGWTLVGYNKEKSRTFLTGTWHAVAGKLVPETGKEAAMNPAVAKLLGYTEIGFYIDDPQWQNGQRSYKGFWIGNDPKSTYNLASNACQLLLPTDKAQWQGALVYFAGDGGNDNGCTGGGSFFKTGHTCDDGGGGVTTNNIWPEDGSDAVWGHNCISSYSPTGAYQKGSIPNKGLHAYYVR